MNNGFNGGRAARILAADTPSDVTVLTDFGGATDYVTHRWVYL
jgi:hypothetical protein